MEQEAPIVVVTGLVSTRIPWKTAGKELVADRPEVESERFNAVRECARQLGHFLSHRAKAAHEKRRLGVFEQYLPRIATFATKLAGQEKVPDVKPLLRQIATYGCEDSDN